MRPDGVVQAARAALGRPALLAWCGLLTAIDVAALVLFAVLAYGRGVVPGVAIFVGYRLVLIAATAATLPGAYAIYRQSPGDETSGIAPIRSAFGVGKRGVVRGASRSVLAALATRAVAIPVVIAVAAVFSGLTLGIDTLVVWASAAGVAVDRGLVALVGVFLIGAASVWLVLGALAYHDLLAIDGEANARWAWRESLVATTAAPAWCVGQALLRGLLLASPWVVLWGMTYGVGQLTTAGGDSIGLPAFLASVLLALLVAIGARATLVAYHVDTYEDEIRPTVTSGDRTIVEHPRRVAVAVLVVLAAVAGVAMVRTADVGPGPSVPDANIQPSNAEATVSTAVERTLDRDYAFSFTEETYNRSTGRWRTIFDGSGRIDRDAPEATITIALHFEDGSVDRRTFYAADGIYALQVPTGRIRTSGAMEVHVRSGNWTAAIGRPFFVTEEDLQVLPRADVNWARVASDGETVTYATTELGTLGDVDLSIRPPDPADPDVEYLEETGARVVVDRETATVRRFEMTAHFREHHGENDSRIIHRRTTLNVTATGDVTVDRPVGLSGPGPLERMWDVVFYG